MKKSIQSLFFFCCLAITVVLGPTTAYAALTPTTFDAVLNGKSYEVKYEIENAWLEEATTDDSGIHLIVSSIADDEGRIELALPMSVIKQIFLPSRISPVQDYVIVLIDSLEYRGAARILDSTCQQIVMEIVFPEDTRNIDLLRVEPVSDIQTVPEEVFITPFIFAEGESFRLGVVTDSDFCNFSFIKEEKKLHVDIAAERDGVFQITIPERLLGGNYTVLIDGKTIDDFTIASSDQEGSNVIKVTFKESSSSIDIIGTSVIPEFSVTSIILTIALTGLTVTALAHKRIGFRR